MSRNLNIEMVCPLRDDDDDDNYLLNGKVVTKAVISMQTYWIHLESPIYIGLEGECSMSRHHCIGTTDSTAVRALTSLFPYRRQGRLRRGGGRQYQ